MLFILSLGRDHVSGERSFQDSLLHKQQRRLRSRFNGTTQKAEAKNHTDCSWIKTTYVYASKVFFLSKQSGYMQTTGWEWSSPYFNYQTLHRNQLIFISVQADTAIVFQFPGRLPDTPEFTGHCKQWE